MRRPPPRCLGRQEGGPLSRLPSRSLWLVLRTAPCPAQTPVRGLPPCSEHSVHGYKFSIRETVGSPLLGCLHGSARVQAGRGGDGSSGVT